jgi:hypothetical protein
MFRVATCDDMAALNAGPAGLELKPDVSAWSLKRFGYLAVRSIIDQLEPGPILEAGAGFVTTFAQWYAGSRPYWMADTAGFYDPAVFAAGQAARGPGTRFVDTLLGQNHPDLPDGHFTATFSVSVLEHVDPKQIPGVAQDLFRVTAPGGLTIHTIDTTVTGSPVIHRRWLTALTEAGFQFDPSVVVRPTGTSQTADKKAVLIEPIEVRTDYFRLSMRQFLEQRPSILDHFTTLFCVARRPPIG